MIMPRGGIDRYSTFGLRDEWLPAIFTYEDEWIERNSFGPVQVKAVKNWLLDGGLIDKNGITPLFRSIREIYFHDPESAWQIIWTEFYYGSPAVRLFCDETDFETELSMGDLVEIFSKALPGLKGTTIKNPVSAVLNMFKLSRLGVLVSDEGNGREIRRIHLNSIEPHVAAYSVIRLMEEEGLREIRIGDLYHKNAGGGPFKLFGTEEPRLRNLLHDAGLLISPEDDVVRSSDISSKKILDDFTDHLLNYAPERPELDAEASEVRRKLIESIKNKPGELFGDEIDTLNGFLAGPSLRDLRIHHITREDIYNSELFRPGDNSIDVVLVYGRIEDSISDGVQNVLYVSMEWQPDVDEMELLIDCMAHAEVSGERGAARRLSLKLIGDMMESGFRWHVNGESGHGEKLYQLSEIINNSISMKIFTRGPETIPELRGNRNLWRRGNYRKVYEIFLLSRTLNEFRSKTGKGLISFLSYLLRDSGGDWIVDDCLRLRGESDHPVRRMLEETVERLSMADDVKLPEALRFLSEPPYGLRADMIGHAAVSFILRNLKGHIIINGRIIEEIEYDGDVKEILYNY
ncbi:MAG: hypothetical protein QMC92_02425 [Methanothermobacter wolfeii]|nr:hypothetical protein [Methanothermobacter wolfeii]